jgi:hypothetical protein
LLLLLLLLLLPQRVLHGVDSNYFAIWLELTPAAAGLVFLWQLRGNLKRIRGWRWPLLVDVCALATTTKPPARDGVGQCRNCCWRPARVWALADAKLAGRRARRRNKLQSRTTQAC